ncbi:MAG: hypothetical protein LBV12_08175 [Puniceicoccales bacterium]|jgi:hypothetical protein|nr:hypothetical protein [Puniceicoccales bacterium]
MKFYTKNKKTKKHTEANELIILASPDELTRLSRFFAKNALLLKKWDTQFGHAHLQDFERDDDMDRFPDIIIGVNGQND